MTQAAQSRHPSQQPEQNGATVSTLPGVPGGDKLVTSFMGGALQLYATMLDAWADMIRSTARSMNGPRQ